MNPPPALPPLPLPSSSSLPRYKERSNDKLAFVSLIIRLLSRLLSAPPSLPVLVPVYFKFRLYKMAAETGKSRVASEAAGRLIHPATR